MSNVLKNKMYDYEVIPPVTVWENVSVTLNEIGSQKNIAQKLYNHEVTAPGSVWAKIADKLSLELQETKFRTDVLNLQIQPPSFTWNKIAEQLETEKQESFSKKIYEFEVLPPVNSWNKIVALLNDEQTTTPLIPIRKNNFRILRIAAAAVIIGIITWTGFNLLNNGKNETGKNTLANKDVKNILPETTAIETKETQVDEEIKKTNTITGNITETVLVKPATKDVRKWTTPQIRKKLEPVYTLAETESHASSDIIAIADARNLHRNKRNSLATATTEANTDTRYLVYLTEQGDIVKLSKKLADLKCIYTKDGNVSQDALAKLDASQCYDQLKYWQEKMANSPLQSSSNPLELMEILK